jgi:predicted Zn finger-like uncharacterized protein
MALITQCPNCATTFRVTPLDLQAHGGDVRCGRCAHIFNGYSMLATLRALKSAPAPAEAEARTEGGAVTAEMGQPNDVSVAGPRPASEVESGRPMTEPAHSTRSSVVQTVLPEDAQQGEPPVQTVASATPAVGQFAKEQPTEEPPAEESPTGEREAATPFDDGSIDRKAGGKEPIWRMQETDAQERAFTAGNGREEPVFGTPEAATQDQEDFTEESYSPRAHASDKAESRLNTVATFALAFGSLILLFLLAAQAVYLYRAELAAMVPAAKPYLASYCELLDCTIRLPQRTKLLNIETSDMQSDAQRPGVITLSATIRNHASYPQAFPLFQLTLIDAKDRPLASRTFLPETYLGHKVDSTDAIAPNDEINISLHLESGDLKAAGYRLSLLYPGS